MIPTWRTVVVVEDSTQRCDTVRRLVYTEYGIMPLIHRTWRGFFAGNVRGFPNLTNLLVLNADLVASENPGPTIGETVAALMNLRDPLIRPVEHTILIHNNAEPPACDSFVDLRRYPKGRCFPFQVADVIDENEFLKTLRTALGLSQDPLPQVRFSGKDHPEPILEHQLRSLHPEGYYKKARETLRKILRAFWGDQSVDVGRMGQGFSGALVLRVQPDSTDPRPGSSYVLKIVPAKKARAIENELNNWRNIDQALQLAGLQKYVPNRVPLLRDEHSHRYVAISGHHAVAFQELGEEVGDFRLFHDVYRLHPNKYPKECSTPGCLFSGTWLP
jgi:hypothetical protein